MKKKVKRLTLHRETLSTLDAAKLQDVAGATRSCVRSCDLPCQTNEWSYCVGVCPPR